MDGTSIYFIYQEEVLPMIPENLRGIASIIITIFAVLVALFIVLLLASPVSAEVLSYGTEYNYSASILPNNSYVHQGENISQGRYYDLSGVYGFSGQLAHWTKNWNVGVGMPDDIITIENPRRPIYIDPKVFPVGRWFQWDGQVCKDDEWCSSGFGHGNAYVFAVVAPVSSPPVTKNVTMVYHSNITVQSGDDIIQIPVTAQVTVQVVEPTAAVKGAVTVVIPPAITPTPVNRDIAIVTPKAPVSIMMPVFAVVLGGILIWRRK